MKVYIVIEEGYEWSENKAVFRDYNEAELYRRDLQKENDREEMDVKACIEEWEVD